MCPNGATGASITGLIYAAISGHGNREQDLSNAFMALEKLAKEMRQAFDESEDDGLGHVRLIAAHNARMWAQRIDGGK